MAKKPIVGKVVKKEIKTLKTVLGEPVNERSLMQKKFSILKILEAGV